MTTATEFDFGLSDDEYWSSPTRTDETIIRTLWARDRDSVVIGAPKRVALDVRESLPMVVYRAGSFRDLRALSFDAYAILVAVDLERNRARVRRLVNIENAKPSAPLDPDTAPEGKSSEGVSIDLREELGLPWQPGAWLLTVILRDIVSNRARVELGKSQAAYHDEEVARFLANQRQQPAAPTVSPKPGHPLPSYAAIAGSPAIPDHVGIALTTDRVVVAREGARSVLRGAFRLPVLPHERVDGNQAILGITLVVTASERPTTAVLRLDVPGSRVAEAELATGHFALDMLAERLVGPPQTYFVHAFSGEIMAGPTPAAIVAESML